MAHIDLSFPLKCLFVTSEDKRFVTLNRPADGPTVAPAEIWLLDEPTVGLDAASLERLSDAIADQRARGGRVVAATHAALEAPGAEVLALDDYAVAPELAHAAWGAGW